MEIKEHIKRHKKLHEGLDELVADWIIHNKKGLSEGTIIELIKWSYSQTINPTEAK